MRLEAISQFAIIMNACLLVGVIQSMVAVTAAAAVEASVIKLNCSENGIIRLEPF